MHRDPLDRIRVSRSTFRALQLQMTPIIGIKSKASRPFMDPCSSIFLFKHTGASCSHCATVQDEYYASYFFYPTHISLFLIRRKTRLAPPLRIDCAAHSTSVPVPTLHSFAAAEEFQSLLLFVVVHFSDLVADFEFFDIIISWTLWYLPGHGFLYISMHY